ncbi:glycosyltransferase family 2 protein [Streptomyces sp. NBC_01465]|uniref:glycosyltransferase family 2 protein n=1 Tax=Streptomyces sp. NBC_01465 TaxID=2903878 RepID=UPI002E312AA8|nr:glycosyltransferase [Streptomyces sp. NBC_01465]
MTSPENLKISVIVPVYNPGPFIDDLVSSLLRQTMAADEFEAIFVNDGSTDGTGDRLDAVAAEHANIKVVHIPNSGWPSRPRNIGIDHARGEYVQFADNDDWFGDEALHRLYAYAKENDADVVIGKMTGVNRGVPRELFRKNYPDATYLNSPLVDSLTPHKMYRRAFLLEHNLRFPEGKRRLEDHVFVTAANFAAKRISVLSDYTCYYHVGRPDAGNAGFQRFDPAGYFGNLCEALDIVDAHTEPGALRDRLHRRWLRVEIVGRLTGKRYLNAPDDWNKEFFREARKVATERFAPGVAAGLPAMQRATATLLVQDRPDAVRELAQWDAGLKAQATAEAEGSPLRITATGELITADGPLAFVHTEAGVDAIRTPVADLDPAILDVTKRMKSARMDIVARRRGSAEECFLPVETTTERIDLPDGGFRLVHSSVAVVTPDALNSGRNAGTWDLKVRIQSCGWARDAKLPVTLHIATNGAPPSLTAPPKTASGPRPKRSLARRVAGKIRRTLRG